MYRLLCGGVLAALIAAAHAEDRYVTDKLFVGLRASAEKDAAVVKSVVTGTPLTVLEKTDSALRVREPGGVEGWLEPRYVTGELPPHIALERLRGELAQAQADLARAKTAVPITPGPMAPTPAAKAPANLPWYLWLIVSFAMLTVGFFAGQWWLRETYRRRLGGMYLRI